MFVCVSQTLIDQIICPKTKLTKIKLFHLRLEMMTMGGVLNNGTNIILKYHRAMWHLYLFASWVNYHRQTVAPGPEVIKLESGFQAQNCKINST